MGQITYTTQEVTPELAKKWLNNMVDNRNPRESKVSQYAKDMHNGAWRLNTAQPIKFTPEGKLIDGQHRLLAIIRANKSIVIEIANGVKEECFVVLDSGASRSNADVLRISGISNPNNISSAIRAYRKYERLFRNRKDVLDQTDSAVKHYGNASNTDIINEYNLDSERWDEAVKIAGKFYTESSHLISVPTLGAFVKMLMDRKITTFEIEEYLDGIINLINPLPFMHGTNRKLRAMQVARKGSQTDNVLRMCYLSKGWKLFKEKSQVKVLKLSEGTYPSF